MAPLEELDDTTKGLEVGTGPVDCIDCVYLITMAQGVYLYPEASASPSRIRLKSRTF